ncbi:HNH endonuclease [Escherichia coli]|uniref:HNH endonuclease n=1 Tax=Escherichia coli TaxID=562 RepID=UPI0022847DF7|nr:HNH endonuclease [Escherichia coli]MCZ0520477.1 HNH endonuclease [Escherichia coli]
MRNKIKFDHIKRLWFLKDGVIFTRWGNKPVSFSCKSRGGRRYTNINVNEKLHKVYIHEAIFMLHHERAIAEDKEIHHIDGNYENNAISNLVELTRAQHTRIHKFQCDDPMRGIYLHEGAWQFRWYEESGRQRSRNFHSINEAMTFRAEIERPRRQELRALGLNCKKEYRGVTASQLRKISRKQNNRLWRTHI